MSRGPLSTTEELEKLEQSITLTLQEIDHNFSKAHRIVTSSILPLVERYGDHSQAIWEASKFWKQFFEASANVSLSGYEELANEDEDVTATDEPTENEDTTSQYTPGTQGDDTLTRGAGDRTASYRGGDESLLTDGDGDLTGSTPRPPISKTVRPQFADMETPYEHLKREMQGDVGAAHTHDLDDESTESQLLADATARLPDMLMTPHSPLGRNAGDMEQSTGRKNKDPLLHRILDKNYRVQATPHKIAAHGISPIKWKVTDKSKESAGKSKVPAWQDSSPMSSPEMEVPKLRSAAFMSPIRAAYRNKVAAAAAGPRTPGVSVQTPAASRKTKDVFHPGAGKEKGKALADEDEITWESDSDDFGDLYGGISPPKTIQFALPQSKLLQTPAREASRRIVEDILMTAGDVPGEESEYSPTVVKMDANILDDTF